MMRTKKILLKDTELEFCAITQEITHNSYIIIATHNKEQVGYCHFYFQDNACKLSRIAITNGKYLNKGIANYMFHAMENIAYDNNIKFICAIFLPRIYDDAFKTTAKFYQKQGMTNEWGDTNYCSRDEISKNIKSIDKQYDIPIVEDNKLSQQILNYNYVTNDLFSTLFDKEPEDIAPLTV